MEVTLTNIAITPKMLRLKLIKASVGIKLLESISLLFWKLFNVPRKVYLTNHIFEIILLHDINISISPYVQIAIKVSVKRTVLLLTHECCLTAWYRWTWPFRLFWFHRSLWKSVCWWEEFVLLFTELIKRVAFMLTFTIGGISSYVNPRLTSCSRTHLWIIMDSIQMIFRPWTFSFDKEPSSQNACPSCFPVLYSWISLEVQENIPVCKVNLKD